MRKCLSCGHLFESSTMLAPCPACNAQPVAIDGFAAFAPESAWSADSFKPEYFATLAEQEAQSFWFRYRNKLVVWAMRKYCNGLESFFEMGCGTGFVLSAIAAQWRESSLKGSDIFVAGLGFAARRLQRAEFMQMDGRAVPFVRHFDAIGAFDVIEHIEEDEAVLSQLHAALKDGGTLVLTVPQHAWLWSPIDDYACHVRRYDARSLHAKIEQAGMEVKFSTSFISLLLPAMFASRLVTRGKSVSEVEVGNELELNPIVNGLFKLVCNVEFLLIRLGWRLPVGGSRLVVARKVGASERPTQ
jgi:SAM-dependent methyltransferase